MHFPAPFNTLCLWIERSKNLYDNDGIRYGHLGPYDDLYDAVTFFEIGQSDVKTTDYWFGDSRPDLNERLYIFGKSGGDGSMVGFWLDDNGQQHIVHMGSGSGSTLVCVLCSDPIDFLYLLAIGYDEICWGEFSKSPPNFSEMNTDYRQWLQKTFGRPIPHRGDEIVKHTAFMDDDIVKDPFLSWINERDELLS